MQIDFGVELEFDDPENLREVKQRLIQFNNEMFNVMINEAGLQPGIVIDAWLTAIWRLLVYATDDLDDAKATLTKAVAALIRSGPTTKALLDGHNIQ